MAGVWRRTNDRGLEEDKWQGSGWQMVKVWQRINDKGTVGRMVKCILSGRMYSVLESLVKYYGKNYLAYRPSR